jgi:hypothetical protein
LTSSSSPRAGLVLDSDLHQRLLAAAEAEGVSLQCLCEGWLQEGLQRHGRDPGCNPGRESEPAGRCSVRTGHSAIGPVPLPLQQ